MKLVLYSGGQNRENRFLHDALVGLCGRRSRIRLTYVPFCSENAEIYYRRAVRRYRSSGATDFHCLRADRPFSESELKRALGSDIIYLAGGNTFYFLHSLRRSRLIAPLRKFVAEGGVLAGLSAGAILMTPNIRLAEVPGFDADENEVGLRDLRALGLTPFEFSPHYVPTQARDRCLIAYSRKTPHPIYACPDGGGIVVDGDRFTAQGKIMVFHRGIKLSLT